MKKKLTAFLLALMMLTQVLVPGSAWAKESKSYPETDSNLVQVGMTGAENYPKLTNKVILDIQKEATLNSRKNMQDKTGLVPFNTPYLPGQEIPDKDKPKIVGNVSANFTTKGLDDGTFDWEGVFGKDSNGKPGKAKLIFVQWLKNKETGVKYELEVSKDGKYSWNDWEGKPARIPLYSQGLEAFTYSVYLDQDVSDKVKLLTYRIAGTPSSPGYHKDPETGLNMADIVIDLSIQQVASTKFVSEWHTGLAEDSKPPVEGEFDNKIDEYPGYFPFSKDDGGSIIIRNDLVNNSDYEDPGYSEYGSSSLIKTPEVKVTEGLEFEDENDEQGTPTYVFDETNKIIQTKDKKHKFKYDFTYDVINGGKLTMTEIIPLTFYANGGKFASIADPNAEQKIIKEVDYGKDLTDEAEKPTKDRETFKGWSTTQDGKTPVTDDDFKNIKEAKTFYAIWDNNDIVADQLEVKESFKDGDTWVNNFIPTLDTLKKQVKIKDANGDPQALANDDKIAIVDGINEYTTDAAAKDYLYNLLKEDAATEVSRNVTITAKITHADGTSQTVDIPIKVIKNIYEAKTEEGKPNYVPEGYVKVTVDPTTKATEPQKYFYYVNPKAEVVIPGKDPVGTGDNLFVKWTMKADDATGEGSEYKLSEKPRTKFEKASTITAQYSADVVPAKEDGTKPEGTPDNFVKVTFVPTDKATDETKANKIFYVNPDKAVTIPVANPVAKAGFIFKEWKIGDVTTGETYTVGTPKKFENETTITATYTESENIIEYDPKNPTAKPDGYITVSFEADLGLKLKDVKYYFVKKNAKDTEGNLITLGSAALKKPGYQAANGYEFNGWDKADSTTIGDKDIVVTALAKQASSPGKPGDEPGYRPYPEIIYRDRIVEKEKIVEKIVKVGENDELHKEIRYMQGYNGKFRPYDGLTRAEAAQILANALKADGYRYDANYALSYTDVGNKWYTDAVRVVTQANVFQGYSDGTFRPQSKITRAEWVATLRRFQDLKEANGNTMMLRSGHWATAEVEAAYEAGWLGVYQDGTAKFDADKPITRQEVAYVSNRAFRRVLDKVYLRRSVNTLLTYKDINPSMPLYEDILCASNTLLTDNNYYKANTIVMDNVTFNIVTDYLDITQKKFQYNVIR